MSVKQESGSTSKIHSRTVESRDEDRENQGSNISGGRQQGPGGKRALPGARPCPPAPRGPRSLGGLPMWPTWLTLPCRLHASGLYFSLILLPRKDSGKPPLSEHAAPHSAHLCTAGTLRPPALRLALPHMRGSVSATSGPCLYRTQDGPDQYPITGDRHHLTTGHKTPPE